MFRPDIIGSYHEHVFFHLLTVMVTFSYKYSIQPLLLMSIHHHISKMAWSVAALFYIFNLFMIIATHGVHGANVRCEDLAIENCAFSVASSGNRCVLEKILMKDGTLQFQCQSSIAMAERLVEWIESDECLDACGLERMAAGLSTDSLLEQDSAMKLCSSYCQNNCPNIVDLYLNLAAGEGISLPNLCAAHRSRSRRMMESVLLGAKSSITAESFGAMAPESSLASVPAPSPSPSFYSA